MKSRIEALRMFARQAEKTVTQLVFVMERCTLCTRGGSALDE